jgi:hypothetical protein
MNRLKISTLTAITAGKVDFLSYLFIRAYLFIREVRVGSISFATKLKHSIFSDGLFWFFSHDYTLNFALSLA